MPNSRAANGANPAAPTLNGAFVSGINYDHAGSAAGEAARLHRCRGLRQSAPPLLQAKLAGVEADPDNLELILGVSNLLPFDFLRRGDRLGRAVVQIRRADGAAGTGFLVAPDLLLTNHHVLPDAAAAASARAMANHEPDPPPDRAGVPAAVPLDPSALFVTNRELDFTFCGVRGLDHLGAVALSRDSWNILKSECVNIIQHPRGGPKQVALQDNRVVRADNVVLHYTCDTEPGSSGSPVFNNQWDLVALHHASVPTDEPNARRRAGGGGVDPSVTYLNEGIRLSAIAAWLEATDHHRDDDREAIARLRSTFRGLDPQTGFFGALGRRPRGKTAAEVVVEAYRAEGDAIDLGFWDLADLAPSGPPSASVAEIARVIAAMGLDVWSLAGLAAEEVEELAGRLADDFGIDQATILAPPSGGRGLAVLARRSRALCIESRPWREPDLPPRLVLKSRVRRGRVATVGLVPLGGVATAEALDRTFAAMADDPVDDWILIGPPAEPIPFPMPSGDRLQARALAEGDDGCALVLGGASSRVERLIVSPNLETAERPHVPAFPASDRSLPMLGRHVREPIAVRLCLSRESIAPVAPALAAPNSGPAPPPEAEARLEAALREILRPILTKIVREVGEEAE